MPSLITNGKKGQSPDTFKARLIRQGKARLIPLLLEYCDDDPEALDMLMKNAGSVLDLKKYLDAANKGKEEMIRRWLHIAPVP